MKKLLYVTHSAGFKHDALEYSQEVVKKMGADSGFFESTGTDDVSTVDWNDLSQYDAIMFCTTGELPISDEGKANLIDFVKSGKGFIGIHNATDTLYKFEPYGEMIGGYFNGHPWHQDVNVIVEDKDHPSTRHLGDSFPIHDEIYTQRNWSRDKTHVLMHLDMDSVDKEKAKGFRDDLDVALAWCHPYGDGRVFYTALGHSMPTWTNENFQKHLLGGILWAMGIES